MGRFFSLPSRTPRSLVGVDIGGRRVKLLEFDRSGDGYRVLAYANEALPANAVEDSHIVEPEAVAEVILRALDRSGSRTRDAAVAVSGPSVISKIIHMPAGMEDAEMEQQIHFDASHHIPHPVEEVNLDFQILDPDPDNPQFNRVLLVACRRDNIEMRTAALEMAGMEVRVIDVEEYALQNACRLLSPQMAELSDGASTAVFDVGGENTRLTVQRDSRSRYTREIGFRGTELTDQLIQTHELADFDELCARLRSGELRDKDVAPQMTAFAERLATHMDRALSFYHSAAADSDEPIDLILVTGIPALCPGLDTALAELLAWPVSLGNPLDGMLASEAARRTHVDTDASTLMITAGLALRGVT